MSAEHIPLNWRGRAVRLNPCKELAGVQDIIEGKNPHEHNLAEAIAIKQGRIIYLNEGQSPLLEDQKDQ